MIINSTTGGIGRAPRPSNGTSLLASIDVEWTKNYHVKNGNRAFCYSVVWLPISAHGKTRSVALMPWSYTSVYLEPGDDIRDLLRVADADVKAAIESASLVVGHQLCSDLAVLARNAGKRVPRHIDELRRAWASRRAVPPCRRRVLDSRFDADHILSGASRRLVDVCQELALNVMQPELAGTSITALHKKWLCTGQAEARERISVLNLRHSLSSGLVALRATGRASWRRPISVNGMLARQLAGRFAWIDHPTFQALLNLEP